MRNEQVEPFHAAPLEREIHRLNDSINIRSLRDWAIDLSDALSEKQELATWRCNSCCFHAVREVVFATAAASVDRLSQSSKRVSPSWAESPGTILRSLSSVPK